MATNNNKHIITNEIMSIGQLFFPSVIFLSTSESSVVFNISSSRTYTNFPKIYFLHEQLLISTYLLILHALSHSKLHVI